MTETNSQYVLEHHPREIQRLVLLAEREAEDVRMTCRRAGVGAGACVIDVGCGPLGALATLSEVVGASGSVVGLDFMQPALAKADMLLKHLSVHNVRLIEADFNTADLDALGLRHGADLAYCRLVLLHQRQPQASVERLVQLVRPGGFIAYQDILDDLPPRSEPEVPAQGRAWTLINQLFARRSASPEVARDHAVLAAAAGCEVVHQRGKFAVQTAAEGFEIVQGLLSAARNQLAEVGLAATSETEALIAQLEAAKAHSYRYWHGPLAIETLVRTPVR